MTVSGSLIRVVHRRRLRERGDHGPGGVGEELARGEGCECLVFEVADREFHNGVLAVLCFDLLERVGAVGQQRVMAPSGHSSACAPTRRVRRTISRWRPSIVCAICASPPSG
jgi:hypothetical protein